MTHAPVTVGALGDSLWTATAALPTPPPLRESLTTDVCVVGAGIAGMTIAYELLRSGLEVVVLEADRIGAGMTAMTSAHLVTAVDDRYYELEAVHGHERVAQLAHAHRSAIDRIEQFVREARISCDFVRVDGLLALGEGDSIATLERELAAVHRAGLRDVELVMLPCYPRRGPEPCLRFPRQARYHPLHFLAGLFRAFEALGGQAFARTRADGVLGGAVPEVRSGPHTVRAGAVIVATNAPITDRLSLRDKQAPFATYVVAAPLTEPLAEDALVWDTEDPYHYVRLQPVGSTTYLIAGGEDHAAGERVDAELRFRRLVAWMRARYAIGAPEFRWAGRIMIARDRVALIGRSPSAGENVYIVTGESGTGMTHAVTAAGLLADMIRGRSNALAPIFDPRRVPRAS